MNQVNRISYYLYLCKVLIFPQILNNFLLIQSFISHITTQQKYFTLYMYVVHFCTKLRPTTDWKRTTIYFCIGTYKIIVFMNGLLKIVQTCPLKFLWAFGRKKVAVALLCLLKLIVCFTGITRQISNLIERKPNLF